MTTTTRARTDACTREGCYAQRGREAHSHYFQERDEHGICVADSRPTTASGRLVNLLKGEPGAFWSVKLAAVEDEPWRLVVQVSSQAWPERDPIQVYGEVTVPDPAGLLAAMLEAEFQRNRLNLGMPMIRGGR